MIRKGLATALLACLLLALWPAPPAHADGVTLDITPGEAYLEENKIIPFSFTITNGLNLSISNLKIYYGTETTQTTPFYTHTGTIAIAGAKTDSFSHTAIPGQDMVFTLTYTIDGGETGQATAIVRVELAIRKVTLKRTATATQAMAGDRIEYTYTVKNEGNMNIPQLQLTDTAVTGGAIVSQALAVGESVTRTITITATNSLISRPRVTYTFLGKNYTETELVNPLALTVTQPVLTMDAVLSTDVTQVYQSQAVACEVTLTNTGNVDYGLISLYDEQGNTLGGTNTLAVGQTRTVPVAIIPIGTGTLQVTAVVQVSEGGPEFTVKTNKKAIVVLLGTPSPTTSPTATVTVRPTPSPTSTAAAPNQSPAPTAAPHLTDVPIVEVPPEVGRSLLTLLLVVLFILLAAVVVIMVVIIRRSQAEADAGVESTGFFAALLGRRNRGGPPDDDPPPPAGGPGAPPSGPLPPTGGSGPARHMPPGGPGASRSVSRSVGTEPSRPAPYIGGSSTAGPPPKPARPAPPEPAPPPQVDDRSSFWSGPAANPYLAPQDPTGPLPGVKDSPVPPVDTDMKIYIPRRSAAPVPEDTPPQPGDPAPQEGRPAGRTPPRHGRR